MDKDIDIDSIVRGAFETLDAHAPYGIYDTVDKVFLRCSSGKSSWYSIGAAKNAFHNSVSSEVCRKLWGREYWRIPNKIKDYPRYEIRSFNLI